MPPQGVEAAGVKPPRIDVNRRDLLRLRRAVPDGRARASSRRRPRPAGRISSAPIARRWGRRSRSGCRRGTPGAVDLACRALDLIDELEAQLTVYRDDSEVSRLNATAHLGPVEVEPGLFGLLQQAVTLSRETGRCLRRHRRGPSRKPGGSSGGRSASPTRRPWPRPAPGPAGTTSGSTPSGGRSPSTGQGIRINLGSIGKGYAIDRAVELIRDYWWPTSALVHGGRSSLYALGSPPGRFGGRWEIALRNPFRPGVAPGGVLPAEPGAGHLGRGVPAVRGRAGGSTATSSTPGRASPPLGPASVTVLAPTAADGRCALDGLLPARARGGGRVRRGPPGDRRRLRRATARTIAPRDCPTFGLGEHDFFAEAGTLR